MAKSPKVNIRLQAQHARAVVEAAADAFAPGNPHGVVGAAVGPKRVRGRPTSELALIVFVPRKVDRPPAPVGPVTFMHRGARREVMPDVVATGHRAGSVARHQPAFNGLYAGCSIQARSTKVVAGAVACLLGPSSGPTHLLTAGHLFAPGATNAKVEAAPGPQEPAVVVGRLVRSLLDDPGAGAPLDAALVALTPAGRRLALAGGKSPRLPRLAPASFDTRHVATAWLRVFLPSTGDYVARLEGDFRLNFYHADSPFGGTQTLHNVIETGFVRNVDGDSGTILMTDDDGAVSRAVGIVVGHAGASSLHIPVDVALSQLAPELGGDLAIWSHGPSETLS